MKNELNIIIWGANYYGTMAPSQRIKNLFEPIIENKNVVVSNLLRNETIDKSLVKEAKINVETFYYSARNPFSIFRFFVQSYRYLKHKKQKEKQNIFYCYGYPCLENVMILYFAKLLRYKIVFDIVEDNSLADVHKNSLKFRINHATTLKLRFLVRKWGSVCFGISEYIVNLFTKVCENKVPVYFLPICVDIKKIRQYKNLPKDDAVISVFYGGSFGYKDGIPFLLKGFEMAATIVPNVELLLTGRVSRQMEHELNNLIINSSVSSKIKYLGCLPDNEYFEVMVNADILCMPRVDSGYANAGFPFKLGEYLATGNVVIASRIGAVENYLTHKKNAYIVEPESPAEISNAIVELSKSEKVRKEIGAKGFHVAESHFNNRIIAEELYNYLLII